MSIWLRLCFSTNNGKFVSLYISLQLTRAYFAFLEVLFSSHIVFIFNLDTNTFMHIVGSLESGLKGLDTNISSQVCHANTADRITLLTNFPCHLCMVICHAKLTWHI